MAEKIGLEAVMDMAGFTKGMKEYTGGVDQMVDKTEKGSSIFSKLGGALGGVVKVGIGAAVVGFGALTAVIADSVQEAANAQKIEAQLDAVLKATGGQAGMTKDEILGLADALSQVTPYEDDLIASTETVLLQFRNIGKDVFPQATEMALDLATRLGIDATSAAKLLGKALEEPGEGLARLRQAGVSFTDEQQAMIDKMVASGDVAGAQKFIMDELANSIGGAARASGETFAGQMTILQNKIGNVKETIGAAFLPVLTELTSKFSEFVTNNAPAIQAFFQGLADWISVKVIPALMDIYNWLATNLPPVFQAFSNYWTTLIWPAIQTVWDVIQNYLIPTLINVYNWLATNLPPAIQTLSDYWTTVLQPALAAIWSFIQTNVIPIFQQVAAWFSGEGTSSTMGWVSTIRDFLGPVIQFMSEQFSFIVNWVKQNWPLIQQTIQTVMAKIKEIIEAVLSAIKQFWTDHGEKIKAIVKAMWDIIKTTVDTVIHTIAGIIKAVMQIINGDWEGAWTTIKETLNTLWEGIKKIIVDAFTIIKNEIQMAMDIIAGIWDKAKQKAIEMWQGLVDGVKQTINEWARWMFDAGANVVDAIQRGMKKAFKDLMDWIQAQIERVKALLAQLFSLGSPSKWGIEVGEQVIIGLGLGMEKGFKVPITAVLQGVQDVKDAVSREFGAGFSLGGYGRQALTPAYAATQNINVSFGDTTINSGLDAEVFQATVLQTVTRAVRGY